MEELECYVQYCNNPLQHIIEWHGLNQYGENPEIVDERYVCEEIEHLVQVSRHADFGFPDAVLDYKTEKEKPELLKRITEILDQDNPKNQLELMLT